MARIKASERAFQTELQNQAKATGCHVVPIPDAPRMTGSRFSVARVYDLGLIDRHGRYHAVECKQVRTGYGWSFRNLQEHQERNLLDACRVGWGWLVIHHVARLTAKRSKSWGRDNVNMAWAVGIKDAIKLRDEDGHNTLTPEILDSMGLRVFTGREWTIADWLYASDRQLSRMAGWE